jgi:multicomponent Na+:H+ antiporter subunit E
MRLLHAIELLLFYIYEVLISNARVAHDVLTPTHHMRPGFIHLNIEGLTDRQILAASNLITMTPGTLSLDVTPDRKFLQIHCMYA